MRYVRSGIAFQRNQSCPEEIRNISNDELRGRIDAIRGEIRGNAAKFKDQISEIREQIETLDYEKREPLWKRIDELKEEMFENYARDLDRVLPRSVRRGEGDSAPFQGERHH